MRFLKILPVLMVFCFLTLNAVPHSTGFYLIFGKTVQFNNIVSTLGMKWDWTINESFSLGGEFHGFISDENLNINDYFNENQPEYKINYGGLSLSKVIFYNKDNRLSVGILIAGGGVHSWNKVISQYNLNNYAVIVPQISYEKNLNNHFAFGINPSYRFVKDLPKMDHFSFNIYLKLGTY